MAETLKYFERSYEGIDTETEIKVRCNDAMGDVVKKMVWSIFYVEGTDTENAISTITVNISNPTTDSSNYVIFSDLQNNTPYRIYCECLNKNERVLGSGEVIYSTFTNVDLDCSNVQLVQDYSNTTTSAIAVYLTGIDESFEGQISVSFSIRLFHDDGSLIYSDSISLDDIHGSSTTQSVIFNDLDFTTKYEVTAYIEWYPFFDDDKFNISQDFYTDYPDDSHYPDFSKVNIEYKDQQDTTFMVRAVGLDKNYVATDWNVRWELYELGEDRPLYRVPNDGYLTLPVGSEATDYVVFSRLNKNTTYDLHLMLKYFYDGEYHEEEIFFDVATTGTSGCGAKNAYVVVNKSDDGKSAQLYVKGLDTNYEYNDRRIIWYVNGTAQKLATIIAAEASSTESSPFPIDTTPGAKYTINAVIEYGSNYENEFELPEEDFTASFKETYGGASNASIVVTTIGETTIEVYLTGLDTSYTKDDRVVVWYIDNSYCDEEYVSPGASRVPSTGVFEFTELSPGTEYTIKAVVRYNGVSGGISEFPISTPCTTHSSTTTKEWSCYKSDPYENISSSIIFSFSLLSGQVRCISFSCMYSGTLTIESTKSTDLIGYLSDSDSFNSTTGNPTEYLVWDDDSGAGSNFMFTYTVVSGKIYHLFVRCYSYNTSTTDKIEVAIRPPAKPSANRPSLFTWTNEKVSGGAFNITAEEWGLLLDHINAVRIYRGFYEMQNGDSVGYFLYPVSGDNFLALHYNQALMGIAGMYGDSSGYYNDNFVKPGYDITANRINFLRDLLNDAIDANL